jgi:predicted amidohydrolase
VWQDAAGEEVERAEYPATADEQTPDGWRIIRNTYAAPDGAVKAKVELVYRWDADGEVYFGGVTLQETSGLQARKVRLAAVHHRPRNTTSPQENLDQFAPLIRQAAMQKADIVCLPEGITLVSTGKTFLEVSEPVPGPSTKFLGEIARENGVYVVAGIYEREGPVIYNTAVLLGRDGELQGKYRKVCLPREEIQGGITPGDALPVFETDFGRIGMMICWDVAFPEPARMLALQGAEVILMPIWGGNLNLAKARAIENQIYLVSSTYDMKTGVFDQEGELVVEGTEENPVAVVEVDLNKQKLWWWLGDYKNRIPRELPTRKAIRY